MLVPLGQELGQSVAELGVPLDHAVLLAHGVLFTELERCSFTDLVQRQHRGSRLADFEVDHLVGFGHVVLAIVTHGYKLVNELIEGWMMRLL